MKRITKQGMTKQVIVIRKDLNMRKGKIASQVAHASTGAILSLMGRTHGSNGRTAYAMILPNNNPVQKWLEGSFTKICVYVESEEELLALEAKAKELGILNCLITDNGATEFNGIPTRTALAIGPAFVEDVDKITGELKLL